MVLLCSLLAVVLFSLFPFRSASSADFQCSSLDPDPYQKFATKTAYPSLNDGDVFEDHQQGCRAVKLWMTTRHGTRYPSASSIASMASRLPKIRDFVLQKHRSGLSSLCDEDILRLQNWTLQFKPSDSNGLTETGGDELYQLARRMQRRFPHLLPQQYSSAEYDFLSTIKRRAVESSRSFARGLFGRVPAAFPQPTKFEPLLQFYRPCPAWKQQVASSQHSTRERHAFRNSAVWQRTVSAVSRRVGYDNDQLLPYSDLELMYNMCRFEKAIYPESVSVWCSFFSRRDLQVMEFEMDLHYYWTNSYGHPLNYKPACVQVKDFLTKFTRSSAGDDDVLAHLYFSHRGGVLRFITRLGLFNDSRVLLHHHFGGHHLFRSSHLAPFASNVVLVLYRCQDSRNYVRALLQERDILLPGCSGTLCPLDHLVSQFTPVVEECDLASICGHSEQYSSWTDAMRNTVIAMLSALALV